MGLCGAKQLHGEMQKSKGGSVILRKDLAGSATEPAYEVSRGGSIILGSRASDLWEPGQPIVRPPNLLRTVELGLEHKEGTLQLQFGCRSLQGRNPQPPHKPNQDSIIVEHSLGGQRSRALFGVFDGHGPYGEHASHFCRTRLGRKLVESPHFEADLQLAYRQAFHTVHDEFVSPATKRAGVDATVSGSTCTTLLFDGLAMLTANVGDSRAVLARESEDGMNLEAVALTEDHKPNVPGERERLLASSAVLLTEREVRGFGDETKLYVCREREGEIVYGVLFTRSVGDLDAHLHLGISTEPDIGVTHLTPADHFVVVATDGVWDHLSNQEVVDFVASHTDPNTACNALVELAKEKWETMDMDRRRDDISVVIVVFNWEAGTAEGGAAEEGAAGAAAAAVAATGDEAAPGAAAGSADDALPSDEQAEAKEEARPPTHV